MIAANKDERKKEIHNKMCEAKYEYVINLMRRWCSDTLNGLVPPTPMGEWQSWCQDNQDLLDWGSILRFESYDSYFFIYRYGLSTTEDLREDICNCEFFYECAEWYAETPTKYDVAMAILNNEPYIINDVNTDVYI